ncbi:MAG: diguanylate cyclase [Rhodobacteraceae bacterium]|nr:diguanylate cyclase [Paracoccaceae bacterium]
MATAGRLRDALAAPIPLDQTELHLTVSIGLCLAGRAPENTAPAMLQAAEEAMVEARRNGRGRSPTTRPGCGAKAASTGRCPPTSTRRSSGRVQGLVPAPDRRADRRAGGVRGAGPLGAPR